MQTRINLADGTYVLLEGVEDDWQVGVFESDGTEAVMWTNDELDDDPESVVLALLGAMSGRRVV